MKKLLAILAVAGSLAACNNGTDSTATSGDSAVLTTPSTVDSSTVTTQMDSSAVTPMADTTGAAATTGTTGMTTMTDSTHKDSTHKKVTTTKHH